MLRDLFVWGGPNILERRGKGWRSNVCGSEQTALMVDVRLCVKANLVVEITKATCGSMFEAEYSVL